MSRRDGGLPVVTAPEPLRAILAERERQSGRTAPSDLYAEDVLVLDLGNGDRWLRGRAAAQVMASRYTPDSRFLPVSFGIDGDTAHIEGVVRTGTSAVDEMNFVLVLRKDGGGAWRIVMESAVNKPPPDYSGPITADALLDDMDAMGSSKAVILSLGYTLARAPTPVSGELDRVRAENDWNVEQAQKHPGRLIVFCGVNPLRDYAVQEIERCAKLPNVRGVKLHLANSGVDVTQPAHVEKLRRVFQTANASHLALVMHQWTRGEYGARQSRIILEQVLPAAPGVPIQIAHLAGAGPGYGPDDALAVYADAIGAGDPRTANLLFDLTTIVTETTTSQTADLVVRRLRQIGLNRILFGTDMLLPASLPPSRQWAILRNTLPLSDDELRTLASNVAPYAR